MLKEILGVGAVLAFIDIITDDEKEEPKNMPINSYRPAPVYKPFPYEMTLTLPTGFDWHNYWNLVSRMTLKEKREEQIRVCNEYDKCKNEYNVLKKYNRYIPYQLEKDLKICQGMYMMIERA